MRVAGMHDFRFEVGCAAHDEATANRRVSVTSQPHDRRDFNVIITPDAATTAMPSTVTPSGT
jgi:hypothetical protein